MNKINFKFILKYLVSLFFIIAGLFWILQSWEELKHLVTIRMEYIIILIPLVFFSMLTIGYINQLIVSSLGYPLSLIQWSSLAFASTLANYIFPMRAGMVLRAAYFKKCHDFPLNKFAASIAFIYIITFVVNAGSGIVLIFLLGIHKKGLGLGLFFIFSAIFLGGILALVVELPFKKNLSKIKIFKHLIKIHNGWSVLKKKPYLLSICGSLSIFNTVLFALRLWVAFYSIGYYVNPAACFLMGCFSVISMFISITPASLGIREAAIVFASSILDVTPELSLLAASLDRAISMIVVAFLGSVGMIKLSSEKASIFKSG